MATIQVKHVPDDVHQRLRARADQAGQSLQEYLLATLTVQARSPTLDEVLARAGDQTGGSVGLDFSTESVRAGRDRSR